MKTPVTQDSVRTAFNVIGGDLARACADAGESSRVHIGDLTDAVGNYLGANSSDEFAQVRAYLKALYIRGRSQYVNL